MGGGFGFQTIGFHLPLVQTTTFWERGVWDWELRRLVISPLCKYKSVNYRTFTTYFVCKAITLGEFPGQTIILDFTFYNSALGVSSIFDLELHIPSHLHMEFDKCDRSIQKFICFNVGEAYGRSSSKF
jgi:hypothetical protein